MSRSKAPTRLRKLTHGGLIKGLAPGCELVRKRIGRLLGLGQKPSLVLLPLGLERTARIDDLALCRLELGFEVDRPALHPGNRLGPLSGMKALVFGRSIGSLSLNLSARRSDP